MLRKDHKVTFQLSIQRTNQHPLKIHTSTSDPVFSSPKLMSKFNKLYCIPQTSNDFSFQIYNRYTLHSISMLYFYNSYKPILEKWNLLFSITSSPSNSSEMKTRFTYNRMFFVLAPSMSSVLKGVMLGMNRRLLNSISPCNIHMCRTVHFICQFSNVSTTDEDLPNIYKTNSTIAIPQPIVTENFNLWN